MPIACCRLPVGKIDLESTAGGYGIHILVRTLVSQIAFRRKGYSLMNPNNRCSELANDKHFPQELKPRIRFFPKKLRLPPAPGPPCDFG